MGEHGEKPVGERRTPSDDLVEGGLVQAGDSVLLGDRVINPGAGCSEAQMTRPPAIAVTARSAFAVR